MISQGPTFIIQEIARKREDINIKANANLGGRKFFEHISQVLSVTSGSIELCFIKAISWAYINYYEVGKISTKYLVDQFRNYDIDHDNKSRFHYEITNHLRTYFQHNLNYYSQHDIAIHNNCSEWFFKNTGLNEPVEKSDWDKCYCIFLDDMKNFFTNRLLAVSCG